MKRPDQRSSAALTYRAWYRTPQWRQLRAHQLRQQPHCTMCQGMGHRTAATIADHKTPHKGDAALFFAANNLQSLCKLHHDSSKAKQEARGKVIGSNADGSPLDASHHWNN